MYIVTRKHLSDAIKQHPSAAEEIEAWTRVVEAARWHNFLEVTSTFKDADNVKGYVVFDIRRNRFRLITVIHYAKPGTQGHVYIRSFLTHKEYDNPANWDRRFGAK